VRHVYDATDATAFRTHEAATAAVHGVSGTLVGTSDTQTLSNKTLTSPTVNAGALSGTFSGTHTYSGNVTFSGTLTGAGALAGTFSGSPTLSGAPTFSGTPVFTGGQQSNQSASTNVVEAALVNGDAFDRWRVYADGKQEWGSGAAARDVTLLRSAAKTLQTTNTFSIAPTDATIDGLDVNLPTGTTGDLLDLMVNSSTKAAVGNDGAFRVYGSNTPTTYTPAVTGGGTATWTTRTGYYWKLGKMVFVVIYLVVNAAGSGTSALEVDLPSNPDRSTRQVLTLHGETITVGGAGAATIRGGEALWYPTGTGATSDRLRVIDADGDGSNNILGEDLKAGAVLSIQGWYREA
jgi:hypothetical protein